MKPTKNRVFCPECNRAKILFETESKANNFIKFNSNEILEETGKAPVRSYYCTYCGGWHVTSNYTYHLNPSSAERVLEHEKKKKEQQQKLPTSSKKKATRAYHDMLNQEEEVVELKELERTLFEINFKKWNMTSEELQKVLDPMFEKYKYLVFTYPMAPNKTIRSCRKIFKRLKFDVSDFSNTELKKLRLDYLEKKKEK